MVSPPVPSLAQMWKAAEDGNEIVTANNMLHVVPLREEIMFQHFSTSMSDAYIIYNI